MIKYLILGSAFIFLNGCCVCDKKNGENISLMNLGYEADSDSIPPKTVVEKFLGRGKGAYYGLDISHYQGDIVDRMNAKKDSLHFVICKATQGTNYVDPEFRSNWREIKIRGFIRGCYHFYMFSDDPVEQAKHFLENADDFEMSDIAPIVDVEEDGLSKGKNDPAKMQKDLRDFLLFVESKSKRKPIIYTDPSFANKYLNNTFFGEYELWLAEYSNTSPRIPDPWKSKGYLIWQRSESYHAFSSTSDLDLFQGRLNDLIK